MSAHRYPDAYLEHYADRWLALGLKREGITLLQYLAAPQACEDVAARWAAIDARPEPLLLPQQITEAEARAARAAAGSQAANRIDLVEREIAHLPRRDGAPVEALHHRRLPTWARRGGAARQRSPRRIAP